MIRILNYEDNPERDCRIQGLQPVMWVVIIDAWYLWRFVFDQDLVWTAGTDSKHNGPSLHYVGYAVDLRTNTLTEEQRKHARDELADALGRDFDVVLEGNHMHIEFQPKHPINM